MNVLFCRDGSGAELRIARWSVRVVCYPGSTGAWRQAEGARSKLVIFDGWCPVCGGVHGRNLYYVDKAVIAVHAP